jgi:hypothetical protein
MDAVTFTVAVLLLAAVLAIAWYLLNKRGEKDDDPPPVGGSQSVRVSNDQWPTELARLSVFYTSPEMLDLQASSDSRGPGVDGPSSAGIMVSMLMENLVPVLADNLASRLGWSYERALGLDMRYNISSMYKWNMRIGLKKELSSLAGDQLWDRIIKELIAEELAETVGERSLDEALDRVTDDLSNRLARSRMPVEFRGADIKAALKTRLGTPGFSLNAGDELLLTARTKSYQLLQFVETGPSYKQMAYELGGLGWQGVKTVYRVSVAATRVFFFLLKDIIRFGLSVAKLARALLIVIKTVAMLVIKLVFTVIKAVIAGIYTMGVSLMFDIAFLLMDIFDLTGRQAKVTLGEMLKIRNQLEFKQRSAAYDMGSLVTCSQSPDRIAMEPIVPSYFEQWCTPQHLLSFRDFKIDLAQNLYLVFQDLASQWGSPEELQDQEERFWDQIGVLRAYLSFPQSFQKAIDPAAFQQSFEESKRDAYLNFRTKIVDANLIATLNGLYMADLTLDGTRPPALMTADEYVVNGTTYQRDFDRNYFTGHQESTDIEWFRVDKSDDNYRVYVAETLELLVNPNSTDNVATSQESEGYISADEEYAEREYAYYMEIVRIKEIIWMRQDPKVLATHAFDQALTMMRTCCAVVSPRQRVELYVWLKRVANVLQEDSDDATIAAIRARYDEVKGDGGTKTMFDYLLETWQQYYEHIVGVEPVDGETEVGQADGAEPADGQMDEDEQDADSKTLQYLTNSFNEATTNSDSTFYMPSVADGLTSGLRARTNRSEEICLVLDRFKPENSSRMWSAPPGYTDDQSDKPEDERIKPYQWFLNYIVQSITFTETGYAAQNNWRVAHELGRDKYRDTTTYRNQPRTRLIWATHYRAQLPIRKKTWISNTQRILEQGGVSYGADVFTSELPSETDITKNEFQPHYILMPSFMVLRRAGVHDGLAHGLEVSDFVFDTDYATIGYTGGDDQRVAGQAPVSHVTVKLTGLAQVSYTSTLNDMCVDKRPEALNMISGLAFDSHKAGGFYVKNGVETRHETTVGLGASEKHTITNMIKAWRRAEGADTSVLTFENYDGEVVTDEEQQITAHIRIKADAHRLIDVEHMYRELGLFASVEHGAELYGQYYAANQGADIFADHDQTTGAPSSRGVTYDYERALCSRTIDYCVSVGHDQWEPQKSLAADGLDDTSGSAVLGGEEPHDCDVGGFCKVAGALTFGDVCAEALAWTQTASDTMIETNKQMYDSCGDGNVASCFAAPGTTIGAGLAHYVNYQQEKFDAYADGLSTAVDYAVYGAREAYEVIEGRYGTCLRDHSMAHCLAEDLVDQIFG